MTQTTATIGHAKELIFDPAILERAGLRVGDSVDIQVQADGTISLTRIRPLFPEDDLSSLIEGAIKNYSSSIQRAEHQPD